MFVNFLKKIKVNNSIEQNLFKSGELQSSIKNKFIHCDIPYKLKQCKSCKFPYNSSFEFSQITSQSIKIKQL